MYLHLLVPQIRSRWPRRPLLARTACLRRGAPGPGIIAWPRNLWSFPRALKMKLIYKKSWKAKNIVSEWCICKGFSKKKFIDLKRVLQKCSKVEFPMNPLPVRVGVGKGRWGRWPPLWGRSCSRVSKRSIFVTRDPIKNYKFQLRVRLLRQKAETRRAWKKVVWRKYFSGSLMEMLVK